MESDRPRRWGGGVISWLRAGGLEFNPPSHPIPNRLSNEHPSPTARRPLPHHSACSPLTTLGNNTIDLN